MPTSSTTVTPHNDHQDWIIKETRRRLEKLESGKASLASHHQVRRSIIARIKKGY